MLVTFHLTSQVTNQHPNHRMNSIANTWLDANCGQTNLMIAYIQPACKMQSSLPDQQQKVAH